jgi:hypothetical protein
MVARLQYPLTLPEASDALIPVECVCSLPEDAHLGGGDGGALCCVGGWGGCVGRAVLCAGDAVFRGVWTTAHHLDGLKGNPGLVVPQNSPWGRVLEPSSNASSGVKDSFHIHHRWVGKAILVTERSVATPPMWHEA